MKHNQLLLILVFYWFATINAPATVRYVDLNSASPTPPYTNWATAATNIQDAVNVATAGDQILVTNGVYQIGGRVVVGDETNRVVVDKALDVVSVNGPQFTVINGSGLVRCVFLTNGASLNGFSLTNGATTGSGGGVRGTSKSVSVSNCVLSGNSAMNGGGAFRVTLSRCMITGNAAQDGGGAGDAALVACTVVSNSAVMYGGGVYGTYLGPTTLTNCILVGNSAMYGGGGYGDSTTSASVLVHCTVFGNSATGYLNGATGDFGGGGADRCRLINSVVYYNTGAASFTATTGAITAGTASSTSAAHRTRLLAASATLPTRRSLWIKPTAIFGCNPTPPASTPAGTLLPQSVSTWTAIHGPQGARLTLALTNSSHLRPFSPTPGHNNSDCPSMARRITWILTAIA